MPAERRQRLDDIGFVWEVLESKWEEGFAALAKFKAREGHCRVPTLHVEGTFRLGRWIARQRQNRDALSAERVRRLDEMGVIWDPFADAWEEGFDKLTKFKAREGHCRVASDHIEGTYYLGRWTLEQRKKGDTMPADRKQRLDDIGFVWRVR